MTTLQYLRSLAFVTLLSLILAIPAQAEVRPPTLTDGPGATAAATRTSPRLIVQLQTPPLAEAFRNLVGAAAVNGKLDANATTAQTYVSQLQAEQAAFVSNMQAVLNTATVSTYLDEVGAAKQATYQVLFNGLSVDVGSMDREAARRVLEGLPNVKSVYLDIPYSRDLYTSTQLINAPVLWNNAAVGGRANGGSGVKLASVDGGVHHAAPMFSGNGYSYPPGYGPNGLGLTANNNGKIIASRAYFRPWDPPATGDENPWPGENGTSHGVHTTSTAAGNIVTATYQGFDVGTISGVAPRAYVMSYRIFYASVNKNESSYTTEMLAALEDMVKDGADVVNNSWGSGPVSGGGKYDPVDQALLNAWNAGVFVSMSNGNSGPGLGTSDHPSPDYINVAASTTGGTLAAGRLGVKDNPTLQDFAFTVGGFGATPPVGQIFDYPYLPSAVVSPTNVLGCNPWPAGTFDGKAALIRRGTCEFGLKVLNAEKAGATFVVVYNSTAGGDDLINMGPGAVGDQVTISSVFIGNSNGQDMVQFYQDNGPTTAIVRLDTFIYQAGSVPDRIIAFSSRGPGVGNILKPDIAAPGVNILAQGYTDGVEGEARHLGYGQASGTSMASPHVAGAATLLRQIHPTWSNAAIKSALMSTAKYMNIYQPDGKTPAQPLDMGAGRLDLTHAADPGVILDPPSLSYGLVMSGTQKTITVTVTSVADAAESYTISSLFTGDSFTQTTGLPGMIITPTTLALNPGESKQVAITFDSATGSGLGDNQGYIVLDGSTHDAHLAAWARVTPAQALADVLLIDNDFSTLGPRFGFAFDNYRWYYTSALDRLGYSYTVLDYDTDALPIAAVLAGYKAIVIFTGDNNLAAAGLIAADRDILTEYLNNGGTVIAMGQNLAATWGANQTDPDTPVFLYTYKLSANWIQTSLTKGSTPTQLLLSPNEAPAAFKNLQVDLTAPRKFDAAADLTGDAETPPVTTDTTGQFEVHYDVAQNQLTFAVTVVPSPTVPITVTNAHIHVGAAGTPGPAIRNLATIAGLTLPVVVTESLTFAGVVTPSLTVTEVNQMINNQLYINVHTTANSDGEIRGQIEPELRANQPSIDELDNHWHNGQEDPNGLEPESHFTSIPVLAYNDPNKIYNGYTALANRQQPSLEKPGVVYSGRSVYASFGLEGVNNGFNPSFGITPTSRAELLGTFLNWTWSEPGQVTISNTTPISVTASGMTFFKATLGASTLQAAAQTATNADHYRWDFGDGTSISATYLTPEVGHHYATCGTYTVRSEVTDTLGNVAIGAQSFTIDANCGPQPALQQLIYLPTVHSNP